MQNQISKPSPSTKVYGEAGLIYIRAPFKVETRENGQKKIKANPFPNHAAIKKQITYNNKSGDYYSLLMGREFKPGRWVVLLDFDNKEEDGSRNGMELIEKLKMDSRSAPCQLTPSKGRHYLFYVTAAQKEQIKSRTTITYKGEKYNMDVKFQNSLCNCAPTQIEGYGKYAWTKGSWEKLKNIPQLPKDLFELITSKAKSPATTPSTRTPVSTPPETPPETPRAGTKQVQDFRSLCSCLSLTQLDNYDSWVRIGMILKSVGAPLSLWEETSKRSKKYKQGECTIKWRSFTRNCHTIGSLFVLAKEGNPQMLERISPELNMNKDVLFEDADEFPAIEIDTPFLTPPTETTQKTPDQETFQRLVDETLDDPSKKSIIVRSRYGSGKTTFLQRLIKAKNPKRVLFVTYRQTLARDIMRNFGKLGFKNYLDAAENPAVWEAPKLIIQIDSLMHLWTASSEGSFKKAYDMIILDESESLLAHIDEKTMEKKEIGIFNFFDALLKQCGKILFMDGDMSPRSLSFAKYYGGLTYIKNKNIGGRKVINLFQDEEQWNKNLRADLETYFKADPKFKVCIVSQSASQVDLLSQELQNDFPHLTVKKLTGQDGGETKKDFFQDINETLSDANVFLYSPVIESGVDITIPIKKVYGILCAQSNSQRAFLQMINRCRKVEEPRMDFLKSESLDLNSNFNFWRFAEVQELNRHTVDNVRAEFVIEDGEIQFKESALSKHRKSISIYNTVERLNKHPSLFINYLKVLAEAKGIKFEVQPKPEGKTGQKKKTKATAKVDRILDARDLEPEEYDELRRKKKLGKTTTKENAEVEKFFWQQRFSTNELNGDILKNFIYGNDPFRNFLALVDVQNHWTEDNIRSEKFLEQVSLVNKLLEHLGWQSCRDESQLGKDKVKVNFVEKVLTDPLFKKQKRLNELFGLEKTYNIHAEMTPQQILMWANSILKDFSLQIKAGPKVYRLELQNDLLNLIARKNGEGRLFKDSRGILNQMLPEKYAERVFDDSEEPRDLTCQFSYLDRGLDFD